MVRKEASTTMRQRRARAVTWLLAALSSANATDHNVKVGDGGLKFSPDVLTARDGAVVTYSFYSGVSPVSSLAFFY